MDQSKLARSIPWARLGAEGAIIVVSILAAFSINAWWSDLTGNDSASAAGDLSTTGLKTRIETPLYEESIAFYTEHLGMTVLQSWNETGDQGAILGLRSSAEGEAFLELAYIDTRKSYEGMSLQFRVQDLGIVVDRLRGQVDFDGPEERPWGSKYLYLEDPTGVQVILYEGEL